MVTVTFRQADGRQEEVDIDEGVSVMEGAVRNGIDGIDADCGGQLACATCHVRVDEAWLGSMPVMAADERDLLEFAPGAGDRSRLSCQIICSAALDGLIVDIPATQR